MRLPVVRLLLCSFLFEALAKRRVARAKDKDASSHLDVPSDMPTEHTSLIHEKYNEYLKQKGQEREKAEQEQQQQQQEYPKPPEGRSPRQLGLKRDREQAEVELTVQVPQSSGSFWFGSQTDFAGGKLQPAVPKDGAAPRKLLKVKLFYLDVDCVTNEQFQDFVSATDYVSEAELFGWSFVLDSLASQEVVAEVDGEMGYGRVKDAQHWMAVKGATWRAPAGPGSDAAPSMPAVHMSFRDAEEYCAWAVDAEGARRLPTEHEWEYAARGGRHNQSYPWGKYELNRMNIWEGKFPSENLLLDGYHGVAPVGSYPAQTLSGLYNMLGNVWEWVLPDNDRRSKLTAGSQRVLRGGSFVDSLDGVFNHAVYVSTKQQNSADSAASNIGFRCARSGKASGKKAEAEAPDL